MVAKLAFDEMLFSLLPFSFVLFVGRDFYTFGISFVDNWLLRLCFYLKSTFQLNLRTDLF